MSDTTFQTIIDLGLQPPSMWTVVFFNDDYTPMRFVIQMLVTIFHKSTEDAQRITFAIHHEGRAQVGSYTREVASHKADQVMWLANASQHPLQVYPERITTA